jgi:N6-adenosine-specific RNA methylase IME4
MTKARSVLITDPPWSWSGGKTKSPKYMTMTHAEIAELGRTHRNLVTKDSVLLMWATVPTLSIALGVMDAWGWSYKSSLIWHKSRHGTGFWSKSNCEIVLIGTRGKPGCAIRGKQSNTIFEGKPLHKEHSSKPEFLHLWAEKHFADAIKVETFARNNRAGWSTYGENLGHLITKDGLTRWPTPIGRTSLLCAKEIIASGSALTSL